MTFERYPGRHHLAVLGKFVLFGPGIGILAVLLLEAANLADNSSGNLLFVIVVFGYIYGSVPALFAGLIYTTAWRLRSNFPRLTAIQFGVLLGIVAGLVAFSGFTALVLSRGLPKDLPVYLLPSLAGAICGALAAREREQFHTVT